MTLIGVFALFHNKNQWKMQWNDLFNVIFRLKNSSYPVKDDSKLNMTLGVRWKGKNEGKGIKPSKDIVKRIIRNIVE